MSELNLPNTLLTSPTHYLECLNIVDEIIDGMDDKGILDLMQGSMGDLDLAFDALMNDTYKVMFTGDTKIDFTPHYTDRLAESLNEVLRTRNLTYFITDVMPDFQLSWHHLEWGDLVHRHNKLCVEAARDHGKSYYFSNAYPAWKLYSYSKPKRGIYSGRPSKSNSNSWADDFQKFIAWRKELCFVSDTDALSGHPGVLSRDTYISSMRGEDDTRGMVAFESLQGLKGSVYFGGKFDKLKWMSQLEFDLLIIDESQEGVDTMKTERAFRNIKRKHTLYLSGTPFKQLASDQFSKEQIYNWSYADRVFPKRGFAFQRNSSPPFSKYLRVILTASACSRRRM